MGHPISTFARYMYLNTYAFLLLIMGVGIGLIPLYRHSWWWLLLQVPLVLLCFHGSYSIFSSWKDKKRKYDVLMQRNQQQLRPDTFSEFMQAPCGRLLTIIVLKDLHQTGAYSQLKHLRKSYFVLLKENCLPQKHAIYINPDYVNPDKKLSKPSLNS